MKIGSLFSGIGGFDLAARWMGWETVWYSEIDPYAYKVMARHFPDARNVGDITTWRPTGDDAVDIVVGGFPCQPVSLAGKGLAQADERWLWPEFARVVRVLRPRYVVVENVPGLRSRGMGDVLGDLSAIGYDAWWTSLSAADVGAPHKRERVWIVAYPHGGRELQPQGGEQDQWGWFGNGCEEMAHPSRDEQGRVEQRAKRERVGASSQPMAHANQVDGDGGRYGAGTDCRQQRETPQVFGGEQGGMGDSNGTSTNAQPTPSGSRRTTRESSWWESEPNVGRVAHGVPARVDRLRCLGNAIVPQCAYEIFKMIDAHD